MILCFDKELMQEENRERLEPQGGVMSAWGYVALLGLSVCLGVIHVGSSEQDDERTIRSMVDQAIIRLSGEMLAPSLIFGTRMLIMLELTAS
jgi:hypothetical protein